MNAEAGRRDWNVSPLPLNHRSFSWATGTFETARRPYTASVEGVIAVANHTLMVTLKGGARRHEFVTTGGTRYAGSDRAGTASFLPAGCERRLNLQDVAWEWASIALPPSVADLGGVGAFGGNADPFLFGMLMELERLFSADGALDPSYCETMTLALVSYLRQRYVRVPEPVGPSLRLTARDIRRVDDFIESRLASGLRIADLAALVGCSEGHFHRAFRATTGSTPLQRINQARVSRARLLLSDRTASIVDIAAAVGFANPSHFARVFREFIGVNPDDYRRKAGLGPQTAD
ncbi:MAG: AraC family transcriptional regulator [Shinella sp.]|nr:AraC family transcriptional regulator [Shinella sp.]